ncbi:MAG TPA: hypothetical protein VGD96_10685 [Bradyrhizobium sp.]
MYESRFLGKCIDGGHTCCGHRCRVVGNEDLLRRVSKQVTGVEQETSGQEGVRDKGSTSAAAEAFLSKCQRSWSGGEAQRRRSKLHNPHIQEKIFRFQALMHFSFYVMIAALVLLGFQLAYAFYQLALFVL